MQNYQLTLDHLLLMPEAANINIIYKSSVNIFVLDLMGLHFMLQGTRLSSVRESRKSVCGDTPNIKLCSKTDILHDLESVLNHWNIESTLKKNKQKNLPKTPPHHQSRQLEGMLEVLSLTDNCD